MDTFHIWQLVKKDCAQIRGKFIASTHTFKKINLISNHYKIPIKLYAQVQHTATHTMHTLEH